MYLTLRGSGVCSHSKQTATAHKPLELWTVACSAQMTFKARRFENFLSQHMWRTLGTKPLTPEDSTGLVQLLVEIAFIDLEAGDIQRLSECEVAFLACLLCCRAESLYPVRQLG